MEKIDINLKEYGSCTQELSPPQLKALDELKFEVEGKQPVPVLDIRPKPSKGDGFYTLRAGSIVGALDLEGLSLYIEPKVTIQRLLYLALYAAGDVEIREESFLFKRDENPTLADLLAMALGSAAGRAFRQGLWQDYRVEEEALHTVRGRIMVAEQIRRRFDMPLPVEVRYDEYTEDVLANRLIKAAARLLRGMRLNDPSAREGLRHIDATLENVMPVRYPPHDVPEVEFTRLNEHYKDAVAIARLVLLHWFHTAHRAEDGKDEVRVPGFLMDMTVVFQQFVTRKLREELRASEHSFHSDATMPPVYLAEGDKVQLKPDLSWWDGDQCVFVGDVKYKDIEPRYENRLWEIPSADLYQALAYATALGLPGALLVYAKGRRDREPPPTYCVKCAGKRLEVVTVDLEGDIAAINKSIAELAKRVKCLRALYHARAATGGIGGTP